MPLANRSPIAFLFTRDRERSIAFYRDTLGLVFVGSSEFADCYDLNGVSLRIVPIPDHVPSPHTVLGWEVPDIVIASKAMRAKGISFQIYEGFGQDENGIWIAPDGHAKIAWFLDPDGNNLSITEGGAI